MRVAIPGGVDALALASIVAAGAALRAYRLGAADLWLDEANTVLRVLQPLDTMLAELVTMDVHPPLFYVLLRLPLAVSASEIALRLLPWLFGVMTIPLAYAIGRDLGGRLPGLVAAALVGVSAPLIAFSQEGRMYSLLAVLQLFATWSLIRALEGYGRRWWIGYTAASTAALYTHNLAALFVIAQLSVPLFTRRHARQAVISGSVAFALYLPWLPSAMHQVLSVSGSDGWLGEPPPLWLPAITVVNLLAGTELRDGLLSPRFALNHLYLLAVVVPLLFVGWRRLSSRPAAQYIVLATLCVPIVLSLALSQLTRIYVDKTFLVDSALFVIVMALGVPATMTRPSIAGPLVAVALVGVFQVWAVSANWTTPREQYALLVADLQLRQRAADVVVATPAFMGRPLGYYVQRSAVATTVQPREASELEPTFAGTAPRLWVVTGGPWNPLSADVVGGARGQYRLESVASYPDASARLYRFVRRES